MDETERNRIYSPELNRRRYHNPLHVGEIGCYASHIRCWSRILEQDLAFALVLEDDFVVRGDLGVVVRTLAGLPGGWQMIKLAAPFRRQAALRRVPLGPLTLVEYRKNPAGTLAQAVSAAGARLLLERCVPFARPVDVDLQFTFEKGISALGLEPFPFDADPALGSHMPEEWGSQGPRAPRAGTGFRSRVDRRLRFWKGRLLFDWRNRRWNRNRRLAPVL
jgi:glycosyl transferase, family 25